MKIVAQLAIKILGEIAQAVTTRIFESIWGSFNPHTSNSFLNTTLPVADDNPIELLARKNGLENTATASSQATMQLSNLSVHKSDNDLPGHILDWNSDVSEDS